MRFRQLDEAQQQPVKVVILCGNLSDASESNTVKFSMHVKKDLEGFGAEVELVHLNEMTLDIGLTIKTDNKADEGAELLAHVDDADVVLFATPIWWGAPSSLIQKIIERFDEVDEFRRSGSKHKCRWYGKAFGCIVVGEEDGIQAVSGRLYSWATNMGFMVLPDGCARMFGDFDEAIKEKFVRLAAKQLASNAVTFGQMLKQNASEIEDGQVGSIGMFQMSSKK